LAAAENYDREPAVVRRAHNIHRDDIYRIDQTSTGKWGFTIVLGFPGGVSELDGIEKGGTTLISHLGDLPIHRRLC